MNGPSPAVELSERLRTRGPKTEHASEQRRVGLRQKNVLLLQGSGSSQPKGVQGASTSSLAARLSQW